MSQLYPHQIVDFDYDEDEIVVDTVLDSFPLFSESHVDVPVGFTDLSDIVGGIPKPVFLMVFSITDKPFSVDLGAGVASMFATTFITTLKQNTPLSLGVDCLEPNRLRVVAAGNP
jgi:hypothetical protein